MTVCPAASRADFVARRARVTGGSGLTIPSSRMSPEESTKTRTQKGERIMKSKTYQNKASLAFPRHGMG
jgi:hypothetical protein